MENTPKIALLRWEAGHVGPALLQLETLPGNSTNPASYPFEVMLVHVKGANHDTVEANPCQELLDEYIRVCKELADQGVKAITTSCGFNAYYQEALAQAVPQVVFASSLLQVPFAQTIVGANGKVAILTANVNDLKDEHYARANITNRENLVVLSMHDQPQWGRMYSNPDEEFDLEAITDEVVGVVRKGLEEHPDIGAVVLECTDLPPYAYRLRDELGLPVFDFNSMMGHVAMALNVHKLY
ncbi:MAG: aspartate/glutamate racemase family protein [Ruminococcaceae bacterium]|nr:aspartate/glutamate racemase family protein [Oscillospiraceae bacterium]